MRRAPALCAAIGAAGVRNFPVDLPDCAAAEPGPDTIDAPPLQRMQASRRRLRKRYRRSRPEMI
ncbi:hypothetical protein BLAT2472_40399 [Burkholderia latens]